MNRSLLACCLEAGKFGIKGLISGVRVFLLHHPMTGEREREREREREKEEVKLIFLSGTHFSDNDFNLFIRAKPSWPN
jgi:hypothetical protein